MKIDKPVVKYKKKKKQSIKNTKKTKYTKQSIKYKNKVFLLGKFHGCSSCLQSMGSQKSWTHLSTKQQPQ